jgi:hypothetical protein
MPAISSLGWAIKLEPDAHSFIATHIRTYHGAVGIKEQFSTFPEDRMRRAMC